MTEVNNCPLVDWYKFKVCKLYTCKNYTKVTRRRCLELDRVKPKTKSYTDAELHLYKYKEDNVTTRLVGIRRKKAIDRVKSVLVLKRWLELLVTYPVVKVTLTPQQEKQQNKFPLNIKKLGWDPNYWHYMTEKDFNNFIKISNKEAECNLLTLKDVLQITDRKYKTLIKEVQNG